MSSCFSLSDPSIKRMRSGRVMAATSSTHLRMPACFNAPLSVIPLSYRLQPRFSDREIPGHQLVAGALPVHLDVGAAALEQPREPLRFFARDDGIHLAIRNQH